MIVLDRTSSEDSTWPEHASKPAGLTPDRLFARPSNRREPLLRDTRARNVFVLEANVVHRGTDARFVGRPAPIESRTEIHFGVTSGPKPKPACSRPGQIPETSCRTESLDIAFLHTPKACLSQSRKATEERAVSSPKRRLITVSTRLSPQHLPTPSRCRSLTAIIPIKETDIHEKGLLTKPLFDNNSLDNDPRKIYDA